jgi:hypothetical protein
MESSNFPAMDPETQQAVHALCNPDLLGINLKSPTLKELADINFLHHCEFPTQRELAQALCDPDLAGISTESKTQQEMADSLLSYQHPTQLLTQRELTHALLKRN